MLLDVSSPACRHAAFLSSTDHRMTPVKAKSVASCVVLDVQMQQAAGIHALCVPACV